MVEETIEVGDIVVFQAYEDHEPIDGKVVRKGSLSELGRMQLDPDDDRLFYELETVRESHNHIFTVTTECWIKKT